MKCVIYVLDLAVAGGTDLGCFVPLAAGRDFVEGAGHQYCRRPPGGLYSPTLQVPQVHFCA